ncbi:OsmC family protein [Gracilimonas tropica]|uniref:OsmC family protein n=1 Tax=Gracilimonas tropica TaxID=454600 RepID=UPI000377FBE0|nr:OsmC family protein [Gracilimonas tropica]
MKIDVNWLGNDFHFEAENETKGKIRIDGNNEIGGLEGGLSPMQLLLAGAGGCSAIDVLHILEKQKQQVKSLKVEVDGDRQNVEGESHSEYKTIHMHYTLEGDLDPKKVERALELSITKYCSVSKALEKGSEISYDYEIK